MRALRRMAVALALTAPLLAVSPLPAHADTCGTTVTVTDPDTTVWYPCPGPQDQPVGAPVWITTEHGPGWEDTYAWRFIKIQQGGHIVVTNATWSTPIRFYGAGFDSGPIPMGSAADVSGVPNLGQGHYAIYDERAKYVGDLFVVPPCLNCF